VLLVEDSPDVREMWQMWLTVSGFQVDEASNGLQALARARRHHPDLVLMDLCMPVMDGLETIRRLRADSSTASVPIIAMTALGSDESARQAREAGANDYVAKPILPEVLLAHIRQVIRH
jgi:two-component system cell cycle response regulator DivK